MAVEGIVVMGAVVWQGIVVMGAVVWQLRV